MDETAFRTSLETFSSWTVAACAENEKFDVQPQSRRNRAPGGKKFGDLLWPERVLMEMNSRCTPLEARSCRTGESKERFPSKR